jgi:hypothetical protein
MSASPTPADERIEVHVAIDQRALHSSAMAGELRVGEGPAQPFASWLELLAALDAAKRGAER